MREQRCNKTNSDHNLIGEAGRISGVASAALKRVMPEQTANKFAGLMGFQLIFILMEFEGALKKGLPENEAFNKISTATFGTSFLEAVEAYEGKPQA